jgi:hypothetical protein
MSCRCCLGIRLDLKHFLFLVVFGCAVFALAKKVSEQKKELVETVKKV